MFVTHLECSLTGELYAANQPHNLSKAGKPLLVRYDIERARQTLTRESVAQREPGMWKWRELLPLPEGAEPVSLGEPETPIIRLTATAAKAGAASLLVKDEGRLPTGSFKARGLAMAVSMAKQFGIRAHRAANQRQCRRGACGLCGARRDGGGCRLPGRNARDQRARDRRCTARASGRATA